jgi:hypothetical protein
MSDAGTMRVQAARAMKANIEWRQETAEDRAAYAKWRTRRIVRAPHSMTRKLLNWYFCSRCGLLSLKNDVTRRALREGCAKD